MKNIILYALAFLLSHSGAGHILAGPEDDAALRSRARELAQQFIITDGHVDLPYRLNKRMEDISRRTRWGDFDYERAKAGGLNAPFMSIYVPARYQDGGAKAYADQLIDLVYSFTEQWPDKFAVATSPAAVRRQFAEGRISLPMGMENGAPIEGKLENLQHFYGRGVRYITLAHSRSNHISDSSYDENRQWNGLSPFGEQLIAEMNRLGMMIDVSHVTDSAFYDVLRLSRAPVIASHSSCRHFTPGWERNMGDEMIRALGEQGGVICINFGSSFLKSEYQAAEKAVGQAISAYIKENNLDRNSEAARDFSAQYRRQHPAGTVADVADHIDHVVQLAGIDHVALGSDFDGVTSLPEGLQDASEYPNLIYELLRRGYSESDVEKICGGNFLRVWEAIENLVPKTSTGASE